MSDTLFLYAVCSAIAMAANFQYGFSSTYLNTPVDGFKSYINESFVRWNKPLSGGNLDLVWNLISNIWFVGFFVGIWFSPILNDRFGRKVGFIVGNSLSLLASCLRALAIATHHPELLFIGRLTASVCTAITYQSCILYLQECSPTPLRGIMSFLAEISYALMTVIGMFLGTDQILGKHLFWLLAFAIPFCTLALVVLFFLPETPKFLLISKGDADGAEKSIRFYHGNGSNVKSVLQEIQKESEEEKESVASWKEMKEIFTEYHLRKALLLSCATLQKIQTEIVGEMEKPTRWGWHFPIAGGRLTLFFISHILSFWFTYKLLNTVALWSILLNSTEFLQRADVRDWNDNLSKWTSTAMTIAYFFATICGCYFVEKAGRRPLLLSFSTLNVTSIALFVLFDRLHFYLNILKYGCVLSLIFYGFTYGGAVGPVSWFISSELVPQKYRSLVQSLCYAINTVMVVISTFSIMPLYNAMGSYAFLILYSFPSIFCMYYLFRNLPETKGREIHEIVDDLKKK